MYEKIYWESIKSDLLWGRNSPLIETTGKDFNVSANRPSQHHHHQNRCDYSVACGQVNTLHKDGSMNAELSLANGARTTLDISPLFYFRNPSTIRRAERLSCKDPSLDRLISKHQKETLNHYSVLWFFNSCNTTNPPTRIGVYPNMLLKKHTNGSVFAEFLTIGMN